MSSEQLLISFIGPPSLFPLHSYRKGNKGSHEPALSREGCFIPDRSRATDIEPLTRFAFPGMPPRYKCIAPPGQGKCTLVTL
jgi:hypothetical protein